MLDINRSGLYAARKQRQQPAKVCPLGVALYDVQQHQRRATRNTVAALLMAQRGRGEAEARGKLLLRHPHLGAHGLHIDCARMMNKYLWGLALGVGNRFLQALLDALECSAHVLGPFQMPTRMSTSPASSLRSALVKLALSPFAKGAGSILQCKA